MRLGFSGVSLRELVAEKGGYQRLEIKIFFLLETLERKSLAIYEEIHKFLVKERRKKLNYFY
ncbi:MAG: hypothetical protein LBG59_03365 [Candidatus Peribacteria bacterium]|jgi:hypothetical protein|nr:hypothetical protein [Candidatus Peribacteria bacterium]